MMADTAAPRHNGGGDAEAEDERVENASGSASASAGPEDAAAAAAEAQLDARERGAGAKVRDAPPSCARSPPRHLIAPRRAHPPHILQPGPDGSRGREEARKPRKTASDAKRREVSNRVRSRSSPALTPPALTGRGAASQAERAAARDRKQASADAGLPFGDAPGAAPPQPQPQPPAPHPHAPRYAPEPVPRPDAVVGSALVAALEEALLGAGIRGVRAPWRARPAAAASRLALRHLFPADSRRVSR